VPGQIAALRLEAGKAGRRRSQAHGDAGRPVLDVDAVDLVGALDQALGEREAEREVFQVGGVASITACGRPLYSSATGTFSPAGPADGLPAASPPAPHRRGPASGRLGGGQACRGPWRGAGRAMPQAPWLAAGSSSSWVWLKSV
jgi:hypothetical protein